MNRRDILQTVALIMGGSLVSPTLAGILTKADTSVDTKKTLIFDAYQENFLADLADLIIPTTDTPGAKAAGVGPFINKMLSDCYALKEQNIFKKGLLKIDQEAKKAFGKPFLEISISQKTALLKIAEAEALDNTQAGNKEPQFFRLLKEITLLGYFTSEIGCTQALAYEWVPGRYSGCITLEKGQKPWAT